MDKPICPLCKTKHYGNEPHKFPDESPIIKKLQKKVEEILSKPSCEGKGGLKDLVKEAEIKIEPSAKKPFDRVAYQREYMRKRRAK